MSEKKLQESSDGEEEEIPVPQVITDEFLKAFQVRTQNFIKELRENGRHETAREFIRLFHITENLQLTLKDEQARIQELTDNRVDATGRIEQALLISQKDQTIIQKLREEVIEAWKISDACKTREVEVTEMLDQTRKKLINAQEEIKSFAKKFDDAELSQLGKHKVTVLRECERLTQEIRELNKRLQVQRCYSDEIQKKLDDQIEKNRDLFFQWDGATNEGLANKKRVEMLNHKVEMMEEEMDKVSETLLHYKSQAENRHARLIERDKQLATMRDNLEKSDAAKAELNIVKTKLEINLKTCAKSYSDMTHEMEQIKGFIRLKEDENRKLVLEDERNLKLIEGLTRKISALGTTISKNDQDLQTLQNKIVTAEKENDSIKRSYDTLKRANENLSKKVDNLTNELKKRDDIISVHKTEKGLLEEAKNLLTNELKSSNEREKKATQMVKTFHSKLETVESEKIFLEESIKGLNSDLQDKNKEIEVTKLNIEDLEKELANSKHQYSLSVKHLKDTRAELQKCQEKETDIRDRWVKCRSQVDDINSQLVSKVAEIVNLLKKIKKLEKQSRELDRDLEKCKEASEKILEEVKTVRVENRAQKETLRENDARFVKMKNQTDKILRERDLIANQMIRKTDENGLLDREVSMLKITIERGNGIYNERLEDINVLRNEIKSLRSQRNVLKRAMQNTADMRNEVFKLHRKLNQERCKSRVLEDEMATPMNVHRWRKLSHFDPKRTDLIKKCHRLQRNVLIQSSKVVKAEEIIQALQNKLELVEKQLAKRPNAVVHEKLVLTRSQLEVNTKRMKAAIAISRANVGDVISKDQTIEQLKKDLSAIKCQVYKEKREKSKLLEKLRGVKKDAENDGSKEKLKKFGSEFCKKIMG